MSPVAARRRGLQYAEAQPACAGTPVSAAQRGDTGLQHPGFFAGSPRRHEVTQPRRHGGARRIAGEVVEPEPERRAQRIEGSDLTAAESERQPVAQRAAGLEAGFRQGTAGTRPPGCQTPRW